MNANESRNGLEPRTATIQQEILALRPALRAFAMSLCRSADGADDLVQDAILRAITKLDSFQPGTNLGAWVATILRNCYRSERRKRRYEVEDADGFYAAALFTAPEQHRLLEFKEFQGALTELPFSQRQALLLVGAAGLSYEDAAIVCHTSTGTIKSRVNRARVRLAALLSIECVSEIGSDNQTRAVLAGSSSVSWM